ncbi:MAG: hypothetical protein RL346_669 [Verrucomicrobiota bacterium]|jgi:hypothetical protein
MLPASESKKLMIRHIRELNSHKTIRMFAKFLAFLGLTSCGCFTPKPTKPERQDGELAVLFIGNSYSFDVPRMFGEKARLMGKNVRVGQSTNGGWTLAMHAEHQPTLKMLREGRWDRVVIQDHSLSPARSEEKRKKSMYPAVRFFAAEIRQIGAKPMLYQTWGRRDGEAGVSDDDFFKMNARIREGYQRASQEAGGVTIVPVGDAWELEYRKGNGAKLFTDDGSHPSPYGNRVTADLFYESIFGSGQDDR